MDHVWNIHDKHQLTTFNVREYPTLAAAISDNPVVMDFAKTGAKIPVYFLRQENRNYPITAAYYGLPLRLKLDEDTINCADVFAPYVAQVAIDALREITALEQSIAEMLGTDAMSRTQRNDARQWLKTVGEGSDNIRSVLGLLKVVSDWFVQ
jgi:hypothetical protein